MNQQRFLLPLCMILVGVLMSACGSKTVPQYVGEPVRIAVLDGRMAPGKEETRKALISSGFLARTRYENGNAHRLMAELLSTQLDQQGALKNVSRLELRSYMAGKERLLARAFPDLSPEERLKILSEQNPADYGQSLNVDYVMYPVINKARLTQNRFFQSWSSSLDCEVYLYNGKTGELVWSYAATDWKNFSSVFGVMEDVSAEAVAAMAVARPFQGGVSVENQTKPAEAVSAPR
jgi:hypothetical protein